MSKLILTSVLALGASGLMVMAQNPADEPQRPATQEPSTQAPHAATADSEMTMKVRQAISGDTALGPDAHNVRVTTKNGMVTLRGRVSSDQEKDMIVSKVKEIAGDSNVKDSLTVAKSK